MNEHYTQSFYTPLPKMIVVTQAELEAEAEAFAAAEAAAAEAAKGALADGPADAPPPVEDPAREGRPAGGDAPVDGLGAEGSDGPTGFGRGWIPVSRDIGLPGEPCGPHQAVRPEPVEGPHFSGPAAPSFESKDSPSTSSGWAGMEVVPGYHFTPARRAQFLHHLAIEGNVRAACAKVHISKQAAYLARRRDATFRAAWEAALILARPHAEEVLANRALDGVREEIWYRGELVGTRVRQDTRLLLAHLARLDAHAENALAEARAERFDELLALVAGEDFAWDLEDVPSGRDYPEADPILPVTRERHSDHAAEAVIAEVRWGSGKVPDADGAVDDEEEREPTPLERAEEAARDRAEAQWDEWGARVDRVAAALEADELPEVAVQDEAAPGEEMELPYEVKSMDGIPPRSGQKPGGSDTFLRTRSLWSTSVEFRGLGDRASTRRPCGGRGLSGLSSSMQPLLMGHR